MGFRALDHIGYSVSDLDRSSDWYTLLLGHQPFVTRTVVEDYVGAIVGYPHCRMRWALWHLHNDTVLELIEYQDPRPARVDMETFNVGNAHLCLVTDDLDGDCDRLRRVAEFRSVEPVHVTAGPYEGARVLYVRDPDGISIELVEVRERAELTAG
jgi:catechol 2,3-dioxygenase-like lactoylglutathione lyase family enzyme